MSRRLLRRLHGRSGAILGLLLLPLMLSGLLLHHPRWLGAPSDRTLALAIDPNDPSRALRGREQGLDLSEDGGESWRELPLILAPARCVAVAFSPDVPGRVHALLRDQGLILSEDGGLVWQRVDLGFHPAGEGIRLLNLAAGPGGRLLLRDSRGTLMSEDGGESWRRVVDGPADRASRADWLLALHTGHLEPTWLPRLWEMLGWGFLLLLASGIVLLKRP